MAYGQTYIQTDGQTDDGEVSFIIYYQWSNTLNHVFIPVLIIMNDCNLSYLFIVHTHNSYSYVYRHDIVLYLPGERANIMLI